MNEDKNVVGNSANAPVDNTNGSFFPSAFMPQRPGGVEPPPSYSQSPLPSQNQPATHYYGQPQNIWQPQGGPTYPQQQPFQYGLYPPQPTGIPARQTQSTTITHGIATNVAVIGRRYQRRSCTYRLTRLGIALLVLGVGLLITLGVVLVGPTIKDTKLQLTRCSVVSSEMTEPESCDCGRYCTSEYPCLKIKVSYYAKGRKQRAYLYENVYASKNKCSTQPCSSHKSSNYADVNNFKSKYGKNGDSYSCYYNPNTPNEVFKNHADTSDDKMEILHCILWPMLLIVISASMLGILFCRSKGHLCFKKAESSSVPYQGLEPRA